MSRFIWSQWVAPNRYPLPARSLRSDPEPTTWPSTATRRELASASARPDAGAGPCLRPSAPGGPPWARSPRATEGRASESADCSQTLLASLAGVTPRTQNMQASAHIRSASSARERSPSSPRTGAEADGATAQSPDPGVAVPEPDARPESGTYPRPSPVLPTQRPILVLLPPSAAERYPQAQWWPLMALAVAPPGLVALTRSGTERAPIPALLPHMPVTCPTPSREEASGQHARRPPQSPCLRRRSPSRYG